MQETDNLRPAYSADAGSIFCSNLRINLFVCSARLKVKTV